MIEPRHINSIAALMTSETTPLTPQIGECDMDFVRRIVATFFNSLPPSEELVRAIETATDPP